MFWLKLLLSVLFAWVSVCVLLYFFQSKLIFYPQPLLDDYRKRLAPFAVSFERDGVQLSGWFKPVENAERVLVYYGGNAEEVSGSFEDFSVRFPQYSLLFVNYRGYGDSGGEPSEKFLLNDAVWILDSFLAEYGAKVEQVVLIGRSLGSGVASHVASQRHVAGVVMITPFDSLLRVAQHHYPWVPVKWLIKHSFDSFALAAAIDLPVLFCVVPRDSVVPVEHSLRLYERWGGRKRLVEIDAAHGTIQNYAIFWVRVDGFLKSL